MLKCWWLQQCIWADDMERELVISEELYRSIHNLRWQGYLRHSIIWKTEILNLNYFISENYHGCWYGISFFYSEISRRKENMTTLYTLPSTFYLSPILVHPVGIATRLYKVGQINISALRTVRSRTWDRFCYSCGPTFDWAIQYNCTDGDLC